MHKDGWQIDGANAVTGVFSNVEGRKRGIEGDSSGFVERGCSAHTIGAPRCPIPCQGANSRGGYVDAANAVVTAISICYKQRATRMPHHARWSIEQRRDARAVRKASVAATCERGNGGSSKHDAADPVAAALNDIAHYAAEIEGNIRRVVKFRVGSDAVHATFGTASYERRHKPRRQNHADTLVTIIRNVHGPKRIRRNTVRCT